MAVLDDTVDDPPPADEVVTLDHFRVKTICLVKDTRDTKADKKKCNHSSIKPVEEENCKESCC